MVEKLAGEVALPRRSDPGCDDTGSLTVLQAGSLDAELARAKEGRASAEAKLKAAEDQIKDLNGRLHDLHLENTTKTLANTKT